MKMKLKLVEENELEERAKKHRKFQKGMSPFQSFTNPEKSVEIFNHLTDINTDTSSDSSISVSEGDAAGSGEM